MEKTTEQKLKDANSAIRTLLIIILVLGIALLSSCSSRNAERQVETFRYEISYNGFSGGTYYVNEYKIEKGFYLFKANNDSIKLKESRVDKIVINLSK